VTRFPPIQPRLLFRIAALLGLVLAVFSLMQCSQHVNKLTEEEKLLKLFLREVELLQNYQENYMGYLEYQKSILADKQALINELTIELNDKFDKMPEHEKLDYQELWKARFQPVINQIGELTHAMVISQTSILNSESMKRIEDDYKQFLEVQNKLHAEVLKPQFFVVPEDAATVAIP
jgi:hypothetical protein